jgi:hypothetical protein
MDVQDFKMQELEQVGRGCSAWKRSEEATAHIGL